MKNGFTDSFTSLVTGKRVYSQDQVDGPQECHVISVNTTDHTVFVTLTDSVFAKELRFGPIKYGRTSNPPQNGDLGLVEFVGQGVDRGWLVSWTPA